MYKGETEIHTTVGELVNVIGAVGVRMIASSSENPDAETTEAWLHLMAILLARVTAHYTGDLPIPTEELIITKLAGEGAAFIWKDGGIR